jgi:hypothetical protein
MSVCACMLNGAFIQVIILSYDVSFYKHRHLMKRRYDQPPPLDRSRDSVTLIFDDVLPIGLHRPYYVKGFLAIPNYGFQ